MDTSQATMQAARVFLHIKEGAELSDEFLKTTELGLSEILDQIKKQQAAIEDFPEEQKVKSIYLHVKQPAEVTTVSHVGFDFPPRRKMSLSLRLLAECGEIEKPCQS